MTDNRDEASNQLSEFSRHQPTKPGDIITTVQGSFVGSKENSITFGPRGPLLMQDVKFIEELAHFDRERIPERVVHAKGAGAFGFFEVTDGTIQKYCKASIFNKIGKRTPLFIRFSTVGGESGSADTVRDPRGFAIKFYTDEGIWDLTGNNTPIFFIRDPVLFPSFIHTQKRNPQTHLKDPDMFWDFLSLRPESTHQVTFLFSDRGIPDGYRHMNGYGSHTFKLVNSNNVPFYCKFHIKTDQGIKNLDVVTAEKLAASDPDYAIRDLYNAIARGHFPSWTFYIQIMTYEQAERFQFNPFDITKVWPHSEYPLIKVGKIILNRNPSNYFAEVEQAAFCPANMVPGIEPSPDKMLQGRLFSYSDTHRHRLGPNFHQIPVNSPHCRVLSITQRDGYGCVDGNFGGMPNYLPNSFVHAKPDARYKECPERSKYHDLVIDRHDSSIEDNYSQVRKFYNNVLNEEERERLTRNIASHLKDAQLFIQERFISNISNVSKDYADRVRLIINELQVSEVSIREK